MTQQPTPSPSPTPSPQKPTYEIKWSTLRVLRIKLSGLVGADALHKLDEELSFEIGMREARDIALVIDAREVININPYNTNRARLKQSYDQDPKIHYLLIICSNKLLRLSFSIVYLLARANIIFFDKPEDADFFLEPRGYLETPSVE